MKKINENIFKVTLIMGIIIVFLNLIYFVVYEDAFFNKNTYSGILIIIFSLYFRNIDSVSN